MYSTKALPKVSVALCTYNGEKYLAEQLDSLVHQTYPKFEIIAVDDCSSDATLEILNDYAKVYPFLKVVQNPNNLGFSRNFEKAISLCSGDYIGLCDQDDVWDPEKLDILIAESKDKTLVYHDSSLIDSEGRDLGKKISDRFNMFSGSDPRPLLLFNSISGHSMLFEKQLVQDILPINFKGYHDWWIAYVAANVGRIGYVNKSLVKYRQHNTSISDVMNLKKEKKANEWTMLQWLALCSSFRHNRFPEFVTELYRLYSEKSILNINRIRFLFANRDLLLQLQRKSEASKINYILKQLWH